MHQQRPGYPLYPSVSSHRVPLTPLKSSVTFSSKSQQQGPEPPGIEMGKREREREKYRDGEEGWRRIEDKGVRQKVQVKKEEGKKEQRRR